MQHRLFAVVRSALLAFGALGFFENTRNLKNSLKEGLPMAVIPMSVIHKDPETMGGAPVFRGTRVPLDNLFDALEHGKSIGDFVESFPTVTRGQAIMALREAPVALWWPRYEAAPG